MIPFAKLLLLRVQRLTIIITVKVIDL